MATRSHTEPPCANSRDVMAAADRLPAEWRALVHEYGLVIVLALWDEGHRDASEVEPMLQSWRESRQDQWLATDYITAKTRRSFGMH